MSWQEHATCRSVGPDPWFPEHGVSSREAQKICRTACPVVMECLQYALDNRERNGVWGGMTYRQRLKYQQQQKGQAA